MGNIQNVTTLEPYDSHVSFYGKAKVITSSIGNTTLQYLQSYETIVAVFDGKELIRLWDGWSATTGRHIASFCRYCGIPSIGKREWDKMEVETGWNTEYVLQPFNWSRVKGDTYYNWY